MLIKEGLEKFILNLVAIGRATVDYGNSKLHVEFDREQKQVRLSTQVYFGGNYIPQSVRGALLLSPPFSIREIATSFFVNEEAFTIDLQHIAKGISLFPREISSLVENFIFLAESWKTLLEEEDEKDRIYIPRN